MRDEELKLEEVKAHTLGGAGGWDTLRRGKQIRGERFLIGRGKCVCVLTNSSLNLSLTTAQSSVPVATALQH